MNQGVKDSPNFIMIQMILESTVGIKCFSHNFSIFHILWINCIYIFLLTFHIQWINCLYIFVNLPHTHALFVLLVADECDLIFHHGVQGQLLTVHGGNHGDTGRIVGIDRRKLFYDVDVWNQTNKMIGILGHNSALYGYTKPWTTWANELNFAMNHDPNAGSIARPVDQQSSALPLC